VANGSWVLPLGFVTYEQFIVSTGGVNPSGEIFTVNRSSATSWNAGYGSQGDQNWAPGQVNISLVGPGVGTPPPPPPISLSEVLNLTFVTDKTISTSGPAMLGCPLPASGAFYCEVFEVTLATSGINTSDVRPGVATPLTGIGEFNLTLGTSSGVGIAQFGNNSGVSGWALCTPARCGANVSSGSWLPANLSRGELLVVCLPGGALGPGTTLQIGGTGRFDGQLTIQLG
jgi:hypothetical protein